MLREYAELLAISGGDPFKVRAYEKAARGIEGYPVDVTGLDLAGLDEVPSVGPRIARKIREFVDTGAVPELTELRA
jgi:DNA polymerase (family 10)